VNPKIDRRAMDYILRKICSKFRQRNDSTFRVDELQTKLLPWTKNYAEMNIHDLFHGSPYLTIVDFKLNLNDEGKGFCQENEW